MNYFFLFFFQKYSGISVKQHFSLIKSITSVYQGLGRPW